MRDLFAAARLLLLDLASTVFFLVVFLLTKNIPLSVVLGVALGIGQIAFEFVRKRPIDTMQWLSLFLVVGAGTATLITNDPRFVMVKPSLIYLVVGVVMLKPGWMNRYLPPVAKELVPDVAFIFGFVWSGLMFFSAALNLIVALISPSRRGRRSCRSTASSASSACFLSSIPPCGTSASAAGGPCQVLP